jgi:excinuclease ABC subunit A
MGEGIVKIEMQFMADIYLTCDSCGGKRFKDEVLDVKYNGKNISEILDMTITEAVDFFNAETKKNSLLKSILTKMQPLIDVGLGYLKTGQTSNTLSGGEAQRIKLAYFLAKGVADLPALFIFDEPTTGLHFHDISKLLAAFNALLAKGHSIVVIEHNPEIIKCADWIIDLGPEGGENGGKIVFEGIPEDLIHCPGSYTGKYMFQKLS